MISSWRGTILLVSVAALGVLSPMVSDAVGAPACSDPSTPQLAPSLVELQQALGEAMGSPAACPLVDANGDTVQVTTTGLAVHRANGMSVFASGKQHWAVSSQGLESWTGNWHNGLYPPVSAPPPEQEPAAVAQPVPASVEAVTVIRVLADDSSALVVQDSTGSMLTIETLDGCPDLVAGVGDHVFIRSAGPRADLILLRPRETCAIAQMYAALAE
jgi:hypothetical protein